MNLLLTILANVATPDPKDLGIWLGCLAAMLVILNQGAAFIQRFREEPPACERYATKGELKDVKDDIEDLSAEIKANYNKIMESSAEARRRLYKEMQDVAAVVHRIEGRMKM